MTRSFYGKGIFVVDLIIVTIWAFFNLRLSLWNGWPLLIYIPMRIALCFQMERKSPWTLYSAITFLFCGSNLAFTDKAFYPFKRFAYYIGAWMENGKDVVDAFGGELDQDLRVWLTIFGTILSLWIFGLPVVIGLFQRNIKSINWKHKWIHIYIAISFIISIPIFNEGILVGAFMFGLFLSFLPVAYWTIYNRNHRSALNLICNYRPLVLYVAFVVLLVLCLFIGIERWKFIKAIALIIILPIFYALICRCSDIKPLTRHAMALSTCGGLYIFIFTAPEWFKIITLSFSGILALYVAIDLGRRYRRFWIGSAVLLMPIAVVAPLIIGMNPYVMLDIDSVSDFYLDYSTNDGTFIIEKNGKYGLRDRFGLVLEPNYEKFEKLDKWGRYISTNVCIADNRFGIYDVAAREFILDPESVAVAQIIQVSENSFNLLDPTERHFATLLLRGYHREKDDFIPNIIVEPHHEEPQLSLEEDSLTTIQGNEVRNNKIEPFLAKAELVLKENKELSKWAAELGECQHGENAQAYVLVDKARVAINRKYNEIIKLDSTYRKVYDKWAVLMEYLSHYLIHETYGEPFYSMQPMQFNGDIRKWYEKMLPEVVIDKEILFGDKIYTSSVKPSTTSDDIDTFFYKFKPTKPGGYNRMWNEIKPAFFEWRFARAKYAEDLEPHQRLSYEEHTDFMTNYLFKEIKGLLISRNDNVK